MYLDNSYFPKIMELIFFEVLIDGFLYVGSSTWKA